MITKFNKFQKIDENENSTKYVDIKSQYNSLGEYVEHLYDNVDEENREHFSVVLGEHLKIPKKKYNTNKFDENDIVLIEYWYNHLLLPVKIIKKEGRSYRVSHNIDDNVLNNAPDEVVKKEQIVDHYRKTHKNIKEKNLDSKFRISVAVNLMNPYDQMVLVDKLTNEFKIDEKIDFKDKEIADLLMLSKNGFNSFVKILTALNLPKIDINRENCPNEFFIMYITENINKERLIKIMNRFKSMTQISDVLNESQNFIKIYFGLNVSNKLEMEYGILEGDNKIVVGSYRLTKRLYEELRNSSSRVLESLKKELSDNDKDTLIKMMNIKKDISEFSPGYFNKKSNPYIENNILFQGYQGTGNWEKGTITSESLKEINETFKKWARSKKWFKDVQYKLTAQKFWLKFKIKLK